MNRLNGVIPKITQETRQLKEANEATGRIAQHAGQAAERADAAAEHAVEAVTGGKSFPSVSVMFGASPNIGLSAELNQAKDVGSFKYQIVQLAPPQNGYEKAFCQAQKPIGNVWDGDSGPIQPQLFSVLPVTLTPTPQGVTFYRVVMDYKNGRYVQCLEVRPTICSEPGVRRFDFRSDLWRRNFVVFSEKWPDCVDNKQKADLKKEP